MQDKINIGIDFNKVVAEFASQKIDLIIDSTKDLFKGTKQQVLLRRKKTYRKYIDCVVLKYSKSKSFFTSNRLAIPAMW